jgi:hypothetical protein
MNRETRPTDSPATLVAIIVAARRVGDRDLEREMRSRLEERFGVKLVFARELRAESEAADE